MVRDFPRWLGGFSLLAAILVLVFVSFVIATIWRSPLEVARRRQRRSGLQRAGEPFHRLCLAQAARDAPVELRMRVRMR
jgi:uncharacterized membrane-anchored protein